MSKNLADATTDNWKSYQCIGGPHDGLIVSLWRRARNIILIDPTGRAHEYLDMAVEELSPILAATHIVGNERTAPSLDKIEYSGWLTAEELKYAKELADRS